MMKSIVMAIFLAAAIFSVSISSCEAKDVWVERWQNINADIYVMDETIEYEENLDGKFFRVATKEVQNGKLKRIVRWKCKSGAGNVALRNESYGRQSHDSGFARGQGV